mgnify:CR=1 FL=1
MQDPVAVKFLSLPGGLGAKFRRLAHQISAAGEGGGQPEPVGGLRAFRGKRRKVLFTQLNPEGRLWRFEPGSEFVIDGFQPV